MSYESRRRDPASVLGYTTRRHLLLDLDNTSLSKVTKLAKTIMNQWAKVGDCLICRSSEKPYTLKYELHTGHRLFYKRMGDSYHLIFDNGIGYNLCCKIIEALAGLGALERGYVKIRRFRGDMTLRTSPAVLMAETKPSPKPVAFINNDLTDRVDCHIIDYLLFLGACNRFFSPLLIPEGIRDDAPDGREAQREERPVDLHV